MDETLDKPPDDHAPLPPGEHATGTPKLPKGKFSLVDWFFAMLQGLANSIGLWQ